MSLLEAERVQARMAVVDEHIRCENRHDLDAVMATFGMDARYDDEPWGDHRTGRDGVRSYYSELMRALPDLAIEVKQLIPRPVGSGRRNCALSALRVHRRKMRPKLSFNPDASPAGGVVRSAPVSLVR
jgi:hypothetical protein